ncbi:MAG: hypothetical protein HZA54_06365 [Planctomycetes bacterium]|nr:hypothetical protein [Planctomycetota bacterium]
MPPTRPTVDLPRVVIVTRKTPFELLRERHGTGGQVRFYLESKGQSLAPYEEGQARFEAALATVFAALPPDRRRVRVDRGDLDRFVFNGDDVVAVVGQDGLVPNAAKYLRGQLVLGINPDPARFVGVLCPHPPAAFAALLEWVGTRAGPFRLQRRVMAEARREDGQTLLALNEIYLGCRTHQSSKYLLRAGGREERQSSSGVLVGTGTGSTGWCLSVARQRGLLAKLPQPEERRLVWFVREPWPSVATGAELDFGELADGAELTLTSELGEGSVIFADGIESDWVEFLDGQTVRVGVAGETLNLVV